MKNKINIYKIKSKTSFNEWYAKDVIQTKEINLLDQTTKLGGSLKGDLWVQVSFGFRNSNK